MKAEELSDDGGEILNERKVAIRYRFTKAKLRELLAQQLFPPPFNATARGGFEWREKDLEKFDGLWQSFQNARDFLNVDMVCQRYDIVPRTLRKWIEQKRFPEGCRIGGAGGYPVWPRDVLEAFDHEHIKQGFNNLRKIKIKDRRGAFKNERKLKTVLEGAE